MRHSRVPRVLFVAPLPVEALVNAGKDLVRFVDDAELEGSTFPRRSDPLSLPANSRPTMNEHADLAQPRRSGSDCPSTLGIANSEKSSSCH